MKLYALLDKKMGQFGMVTQAMSDGHIARSLKENFAGTQSTVARFPEDFDLYEVGSFDERTGEVEGAPRFVCNLEVLLKEAGDASR